MISEQGINKFIELYHNKHGTKLSRDEAFSGLHKIIQLTKFAFEGASDVTLNFLSGFKLDIIQKHNNYYEKCYEITIYKL